VQLASSRFLELAHVSPLDWHAIEGDVVEKRLLLIALVRLDEDRHGLYALELGKLEFLHLSALHVILRQLQLGRRLGVLSVIEVQVLLVLEELHHLRCPVYICGQGKQIELSGDARDSGEAVDFDQLPPLLSAVTATERILTFSVKGITIIICSSVSTQAYKYR